METDFEANTKYGLGWWGSTTNGIIFIRSLLGLVFLLCAIWCTVYTPLTFVYGVTVLPIFESDDYYDDKFGSASTHSVPFLEKLIDFTGSMLFYVLYIQKQFSFIQWLMLSFSIAVPIWLVIKYCSEDTHTQTFAQY